MGKLQKTFIFNETKMKATIGEKKIILQQIKDRKHDLIKSTVQKFLKEFR